MEFCYLVCCNIITEDNILAINNAVAKFHIKHSIFDKVHPNGYSLPCQHSLVHYTFLIQEFGATRFYCYKIRQGTRVQEGKKQGGVKDTPVGEWMVLDSHERMLIVGGKNIELSQIDCQIHVGIQHDHMTLEFQ
jgi:hypothetical protein